VSLARRTGARIAVTGAGPSSTAARAFLRAELDGVRYASFERADGGALEDVLTDTDMLVFVAGADEAVDKSLASALAAAARERGVLVAAIVVHRERSAGPSALLGALREAADMVMIVRDPDDVRAVVAALR
jgi:cell division GTPase FtsZ